MTEAEWLASGDPTPMLEFVRGRVSDRKLRLFAVACCRRIWHLMPDGDCQRAVVGAERAADGRCEPAGLQFTSDRVNAQIGTIALRGEAEEYAAIAAVRASSRDHLHMVPEAAAVAIAARRSGYEPAARVGESRAQADLLREVIGNPFRPVAFDPAWLTDDVRLLAHGIDNEKAFDRMPILADALQDAGCNDAEVLAHCRDGATHVRGCWVLDATLGKG